MRKLIFCLSACLLLSIAPTSAQLQFKLDSLRTTLRVPAADSTRSDQYAFLSKFFVLQGIHFDSARIYAQKAIEMGEKADYLPGLEKGYFALAYVYNFQGRNAESILYFEKAKEILALKGDQKGIGTVLNNIGKIYFDQNELELAQSYFQQALLTAENAKDTSQILTTYGNLAIMLSTRGNDEVALDYYRRGLSLAYQLGDPQHELVILQNISSLYQKMGYLDSAMMAGERTLLLSEQLGMTTEKIRGLCFMGEIYLALDQAPKALHFIQEGLQIADTVHHLIEMGALYHFLIDGYTATGQIEKGRAVAPEALRICYLSGRVGNIVKIHESLSALEAAGGNYAEALNQKDQSYQIRDSILTVEKEQKMAELQTRFETEKKDQEIASLAQQGKIQQLEIQQKNSLLLLLLLGALLIGGAIFYYSRQHTIREKQARMEAQQRLLQIQMNPHFLFNALSSIQALIYEQEDPETATFYLARFAKLMRMILENSRSPYISLEQEITTLRFYLDLQKLRFENAFSYTIQVAEDLDPESLQIPPMFAQPFLENTLEHGFKTMTEEGHINVIFRKQGQMLELVVEDNGIGRDQAALLKPHQEHRSLALEIIRDRLQLLNDKVKQQVDLQITDLKGQDNRPSGTKVTLSLPLLYQY